MVALLVIGALLAYVLMSFLEYFVHGHVMHSPLDPGHLDHHMSVNLDMTLTDENGTYFEKEFALAILVMSFVVFFLVLKVVKFLSKTLNVYFQYLLASLLLFVATFTVKALVSYEKTGTYEAKEPVQPYEMACLTAASFLLMYAPFA